MNLTRSIGLSNFNQEQIENLLKIATIKPSLNQCKVVRSTIALNWSSSCVSFLLPPPRPPHRPPHTHIHTHAHTSYVNQNTPTTKGDLSVGGQDTQCGPRDAAISYNLAQNITYESWSPMKNCPFNNAELVKIGAAHNVSTAQVCLRWILDRGCTIAVGTGNDAATAGTYARENLDIFGFALTAAEISTINAINGP